MRPIPPPTPLVCAQCGEPITDLCKAKTRYIVERGRVIGPELPLHALCGRRFEHTHPLPTGQCWGWLPMAEPSRQRVLAGFADVARTLRGGS